MQILCPTYRLDGYLSLAMEPITAGCVWYTLDIHRVFRATDYPPHAREAVMNYHETLMALLSAGF